MSLSQSYSCLKIAQIPMISDVHDFHLSSFIEPVSAFSSKFLSLI